MPSSTSPECPSPLPSNCCILPSLPTRSSMSFYPWRREDDRCIHWRDAPLQRRPRPGQASLLQPYLQFTEVYPKQRESVISINSMESMDAQCILSGIRCRVDMNMSTNSSRSSSGSMTKRSTREPGSVLPSPSGLSNATAARLGRGKSRRGRGILFHP